MSDPAEELRRPLSSRLRWGIHDAVTWLRADVDRGVVADHLQGLADLIPPAEDHDGGRVGGNHAGGICSEPAVPVGVHPEPAEGSALSEWLKGRRAGLQEAADIARSVDRTMSDEPWRSINEAAANAMIYAWRPAPAVPVVHPEPGDRAERWDAALYPAGNGYPLRVLRAMRHADVEVAAAVAAVRADLEARLTEALVQEMTQGLCHADGRCMDCDCFDPQHTQERAIAAAAVRSATKEGLG